LQPKVGCSSWSKTAIEIMLEQQNFSYLMNKTTSPNSQRRVSHGRPIKGVRGEIFVHIPDLKELLEGGEAGGYAQRVELLEETLKRVDKEGPWRDPDPSHFVYMGATLLKDRSSDNLLLLSFYPVKPIVTYGRALDYKRYVKGVCLRLKGMLAKIIDEEEPRMTLTASIIIEYINPRIPTGAPQAEHLLLRSASALFSMPHSHKSF